MLQAIIGIAILIMILGFLYLISRFRKFCFVQRLAGGRKWLTWVIAVLPILVIVYFGFQDLINTVIAVLHLMIFWLLCDLIGRIPKKREKFYWQGALAIAVTTVYLGYGWYQDHHVYETDYTVETVKELGTDSLRIVQISDSHLGATFDGEGFAAHIKRIKETNPDLVVITGDFVDDDSTKEDMIISCAALGTLKPKYGTYFVFGNHDKGYFNYRDFSTEELRSELEKSGVHILEDETVQITEHLSLTGRQDRSEYERKSAQELAEELDMSNYTILLDHQPNDYDAEEAAGFDLVLSGHTHGGQMFPIGITGVLSGANDKTYGLEARGGTTFIVNSGISDWAIKFKTATFSEFGVIVITKK